MDFRHLRFFIAVAEELHFTRAATKLRVAQPHLSQEIRKLEREIGVQLFARTKRSVALTAAGNAFLVRVRDLFDEATEAVKAAQRASRGEIGRLAIGFVSAAAFAVIPAAVASFRRAYPDVELSLSEVNSDEGLQAVRNGQLDVCLLHPPHHLESTLKVEPAWWEPLVIVVPREHALAAKPRLGLKSLATEPWVLWPREIASRLYDDVISACGTAGFEPRVVQRTVRLATVVSLVASGVGVSLVPSTAARMGVMNVVFRAPAAARTAVPVSFVWRRGDVSPALAPFLSAVREVQLRSGRSPKLPRSGRGLG